MMAEAVSSVTADSVSKTRIDISTGNHIFSVDEPERLSGTDAGPNPLEYMLGALAGCPNVTGHLVAKEMGSEIKSMSIQLEANSTRWYSWARSRACEPASKRFTPVWMSTVPRQRDAWEVRMM